jgi:hypothetical protein
MSRLPFDVLVARNVPFSARFANAWLRRSENDAKSTQKRR